MSRSPECGSRECTLITRERAPRQAGTYSTSTRSAEGSFTCTRVAARQPSIARENTGAQTIGRNQKSPVERRVTRRPDRRPRAAADRVPHGPFCRRPCCLSLSRRLVRPKRLRRGAELRQQRRRARTASALLPKTTGAHRERFHPRHDCPGLAEEEEPPGLGLGIVEGRPSSDAMNGTVAARMSSSGKWRARASARQAPGP